jgi:hypothetical protein
METGVTAVGTTGLSPYKISKKAIPEYKACFVIARNAQQTII